MAYIAELRAAWRPLLAATLGLATGVSIAGTVTSVIAPSLVKENNWSSAEFALVGSISLITSFAFPLVGRLADIIGVRLTALIGLATIPLIYLAFSMMDGSLSSYMVIYFFQGLLCITTSSTVYTRLVVQYVHRARGLALAIAVSGPAVSGAIAAPFLNAYVEAHGWRDTYQLLTVLALFAGVLIYFLIPPEPTAKAREQRTARKAREDYPWIIRQPVFWLLFVAMLLCNLPATIILVQLKMVLLANGVSGTGAGKFVTIMSVGMLIGRFVAGFGLDRFRTEIITFVSLGVPSIGLFLLASDLDTPAILMFSVFCIGCSFGAEGDILAFLVARRFGVAIFGSVMGLLTLATSFSAALGAALLSVSLAVTGGYSAYLILCGCTVLAGATLLLFQGRGDTVRSERAWWKA